MCFPTSRWSSFYVFKYTFSIVFKIYARTNKEKNIFVDKRTSIWILNYRLQVYTLIEAKFTQNLSQIKEEYDKPVCFIPYYHSVLLNISVYSGLGQY